ncbi:MAG: cytochrome C [Geobacter sp.]|nr:cytochrome C [Geobacter sp.]
MRTPFVHASLIVLMAASMVLAADSPNPPTTIQHMDAESCTTCHLLPEADLRSWWTFPWNKRKLKGEGPAGVCAECHEQSSFGHGIGKRPELNRADLPLDNDGRITCATTCHEFHQKDGEVFSQYHLRLSVNELCFSCHEK